jgi:hypothetical protein
MLLPTCCFTFRQEEGPGAPKGSQVSVTVADILVGLSPRELGIVEEVVASVVASAGHAVLGDNGADSLKMKASPWAEFSDSGGVDTISALSCEEQVRLLHFCKCAAVLQARRGGARHSAHSTGKTVPCHAVPCCAVPCCPPPVLPALCCMITCCACPVV